MAIGESKAASAIMVSRWHIHPKIIPRIEAARVIDAIGMFIHKDPGISRPGVSHFRGLLIVLVDIPIPWTGFGVPGPDSNISGKTATSGPTELPLLWSDKTIRRTFEDVFG